MKAEVYYNASHILAYDDKGIERIELTPGSHDEVRFFKYFMKAGSSLTPELFDDRAVLYVFGHIAGQEGYIKDSHQIYSVNTVCFYAPDYDREEYTIFAETDMEFVQVIAHMDSHDWEVSKEVTVALPFFRREEQCERYDQDCKTPGTISRTVLFGEFDRLGRLTCGICEARDGNGTIEKGHPEVEQWNYALEGADYWMKTGSEPEQELYFRKAGDWDYIPAGMDHTLYADSGKYMHYAWIEFNTNKRGK